MLLATNQQKNVVASKVLTSKASRTRLTARLCFERQMPQMRKDLIKGLLGAIAFAVGGALVLLSSDLSLIATIIAWAAIIFFGGGAIVIAVRFARLSVNDPKLHSAIPTDTKIEQLEPGDTEIEERWSHSSSTQPLLSVTAVKWKEISEYRWQVSAYFPTVAPDPKSAEILDLPMYEALKSTKGVVDVGRDDTEVWVVAGEPGGRELVANAGGALAKCIPKNVPYIQRAQKGT